MINLFIHDVYSNSPSAFNIGTLKGERYLKNLGLKMEDGEIKNGGGRQNRKFIFPQLP